MMNQIDPEKAYADVEKLLYKLAWRWHLTYGIPLEECLSECHYALVKAINWRYDPTKGTKFSTQVQNICQFRLRTLVTKRANAAKTEELSEAHAQAAPPVHIESLELIDDLSNDAKEIVQLIIDTPAELVGLFPVPAKQLLARIKRYLVESCGKSKRQVDAAHRELTARFHQEWYQA